MRRTIDCLSYLIILHNAMCIVWLGLIVAVFDYPQRRTEVLC